MKPKRDIIQETISVLRELQSKEYRQNLSERRQRAATFKPKKGKGSYTRKSKHKKGGSHL